MKIGVLGAGQLGRMLALAGYPLGMLFRFFDPTPESPAGHLAAHMVAEYTDRDALARFAQGLDVITYEFENVPVETVRFLADRVPVYPPPQALEVAQDRLSEKTLFQRLGILTPPFAAVNTREELDEAVARIGLPAVLKTRRLGYDGKGQAVLQTSSDVDTAWQTLGSAPLILEGFVSFEREVSLLAVRNREGVIVFYPLVENHHREGILRLSLAPAPEIRPEMQGAAEACGRAVLDALDYVGVLAVEFFVQGEQLLANEMAPRVHNSGHWTIEGAETSQFENHLRAILGLSTGSTAMRGYAAMINLIGAAPQPATILELPEAHLHLYGKAPRPGRKIGHVTLRADSSEILAQQIVDVWRLLPDIVT